MATALGGDGAAGSKELCLRGELGSSQPAAQDPLLLVRVGFFLPAQPQGKGLRGLGTHPLGALVGAVPGEDEGGLARGHGHHRRVDQAQLHDAGIVAAQAARVVEADPRGIAAPYGGQKDGVASRCGRADASWVRSGMEKDALLPQVWGRVLKLLAHSFFVCVLFLLS